VDLVWCAIARDLNDCVSAIYGYKLAWNELGTIDPITGAPSQLFIFDRKGQ
jgi:hypothetical protein